MRHLRESRARDRWYCLCGCGQSLGDKRAHAKYAREACKRKVYRRRQLQLSKRAS